MAKGTYDLNREPEVVRAQLDATGSGYFKDIRQRGG